MITDAALAAIPSTTTVLCPASARSALCMAIAVYTSPPELLILIVICDLPLIRSRSSANSSGVMNCPSISSPVHQSRGRRLTMSPYIVISALSASSAVMTFQNFGTSDVGNVCLLFGIFALLFQIFLYMRQQCRRQSIHARLLFLFAGRRSRLLSSARRVIA